MSVAEELHRTIDELSEEQQQELLEVANRLLNQSITDETNSDYEQVLAEFILKRYQNHKDHPEKAVSIDALTKRMEQKYGRKF